MYYVFTHNNKWSVKTTNSHYIAHKYAADVGIYDDKEFNVTKSRLNHV